MTNWSLYRGEESRASTSDGLAVDVKAVREDSPRFRRIYRGRVSDEVSISVMASSFSGTRFFSGELKQRNGKWITFDPDRIADKIIDERLVPIVADYCRKIRRLDDQFIDADPSEFVDERGRRWVRA